MGETAVNRSLQSTEKDVSWGSCPWGLQGSSSHCVVLEPVRDTYLFLWVRKDFPEEV